MRVTEQVDAMEVSGNNPFKFLVVTRVAAITVMLPVLVVFADITALVGSYLAANINGEISFSLFFVQVVERLSFHDLLPAVLKCFFFGWAIGIIGCFKGFFAKSGTAGVGIATNNAVVIALISVIFIDMIAVQLTSLIFNE
jgi:phospholipid/cholesterol/gamma-HCH transport system permease protein